MIKLNVQYHFFPVGQGLFSEGRLSINRQGDRAQVSDFRWVYDCGTTSSQRLVRNALNQFNERIYGRRLDLVVISHFDADHISGMVDLLNTTGTKTLMLPWAPLWHRLVIGYSQGLNPEDPEFEFYTNPVKYLNDQAGDGFERIVFVPFSSGEGPPEPEGSEEPDFDPDGKPSLKFDWEKDTEFDKYGQDELSERMLYRNDLRYGQESRMMRRGTAVKFFDLWEFIPYNDPSTRPKKEEAFVQQVNHLRQELLDSSDDIREDALRKLKLHYVQSFPKSQLNDLSLFFYGGPVGVWKNCGPCGGMNYGGACFLNTDFDKWLYFHRRFMDYFGCHDGTNQVYDGSVLYTGDGDLSKIEKWKSLSNYIGIQRTVRPSIFQVAHHGSRKNWFDGLADLIEPSVSVFSSDPSHRRFGHPHSEVLRDFLPYRPFQVDKVNAFLSSFLLYR